MLLHMGTNDALPPLSEMPSICATLPPNPRSSNVIAVIPQRHVHDESASAPSDAAKDEGRGGESILLWFIEDCAEKPISKTMEAREQGKDMRIALESSLMDIQGRTMS